MERAEFRSSSIEEPETAERTEKLEQLEQLIDYLKQHPEVYGAFLETQEAAFFEARGSTTSTGDFEDREKLVG